VEIPSIAPYISFADRDASIFENILSYFGHGSIVRRRHLDHSQSWTPLAQAKKIFGAWPEAKMDKFFSWAKLFEFISVADNP